MFPASALFPEAHDTLEPIGRRAFIAVEDHAADLALGQIEDGQGGSQFLAPGASVAHYHQDRVVRTGNCEHPCVQAHYPNVHHHGAIARHGLAEVFDRLGLRVRLTAERDRGADAPDR